MAVKDFSRKLWNAVNQNQGLAQVLVVPQSRMAGFALDTACKSEPAHGQIVIVADTRRDQCSNEGTGTILKATRHHAKLSL